jgi:hypothetical protein
MGMLYAMNNRWGSRLVGPRAAWAAGAILVIIGSILLSIVGDPPREANAFVLGAVAVAMGAVFMLTGIEAAWLRIPSSLSWRDVLTGIVIATLVLIIMGLLLQVTYNDDRAYLLLVVNAVPFLLVLTGSYFGCRVLVRKLGV